MKEPGAEADEAARQVIGAAIEVHRVLGPGFLESVYERALCVELALRGVSFETQPTVTVAYKGTVVGDSKPDLIVARCLVVELKTVDNVLPIHRAQVISHLKATALPLALLLNFKVAVMRDGIERIVLT